MVAGIFLIQEAKRAKKESTDWKVLTSEEKKNNF